ncbi:MAG TPA: PAS domain S-box protein, partial [Candidatus Deferrimicrobiaceae bacterium]
MGRLSSLRTRLLLLLVAALLPAFVLIVHSGMEQRSDAIAEMQGHAHEIADASAAEENGLITEIRQLLMTLARLPTFRSGSGEAFRQLGNELLKDNPRIQNLARIDLDGNIVASVFPLSRPVNVADRSFFRNAVSSGNFAIGDYQIGLVDGKTTLDFAYPVRKEDGSLSAVLFAAIDLDRINREQARRTRHVPPGATLTRVDRNGVVFAQFPDAPGWRGSKFPIPKVLDALRKSDNEPVEATGPDGLSRFYVFSRIDRPAGTGSAYAILGIPRALLFDKGDRLFRTRLAGLALVALLGFLAARVGVEAVLLRPARVLLDATRRFGEGDLSARSGLPPSGDELSTLAAGFDRMAESIEQRERDRQADAARLSAAMEQLRALYDASPDMIVLHGEDGAVIDVNDRTLEMLGCTREEIVGKSPTDFSLEGFTPGQAAAHLREAFEGGTPEFEWLSRRKDGTDFPIEIRLRRFDRIDEDGINRPYVLASVRDISARKRQEAALREAEQLYRTLIETLPDAVAVTDVDGRITYVSPRTVAMFGAGGPSAMVGTGVLDWIDPEEHERTHANIRNVMAGRHSDNNEYRLHR